MSYCLTNLLRWKATEIVELINKNENMHSNRTATSSYDVFDYKNNRGVSFTLNYYFILNTDCSRSVSLNIALNYSLSPLTHFTS